MVKLHETSVFFLMFFFQKQLLCTLKLKSLVPLVHECMFDNLEIREILAVWIKEIHILNFKVHQTCTTWICLVIFDRFEGPMG